MAISGSVVSTISIGDEPFRVIPSGVIAFAYIVFCPNGINAVTVSPDPIELKNVLPNCGLLRPSSIKRRVGCSKHGGNWRQPKLLIVPRRVA
jgi:hypothetical protein